MKTTIAAFFAVLLLGSGCAVFEDDPRDVCRENCEDLGFFSCDTDERIAECGRQCSLRSEAVVDDFNTCKSGGICNSAGCLDVLIPGPSGNGTTNNAANGSMNNQAANNNSLEQECKTTCDAVGICLEIDRAGTVLDCKAACDESSPDAVGSFISCELNAFSCEEDVVCFEFLGVPYTY